MNAKQKKIRQLAARYPQVIEWSEEDGCFIGSAPPLVGHSCHGASTAEVAGLLDAIVLDLCEDIIDGKIPAPKEPAAGKQYSGKFVVRLSPALHKKVALKAQAREESLNQFVADALERV
jgi:predicted HicB family RNase H-like nuclease